MSDYSVHIISTPPGDAPLWVREKWVGLNLPIVGSKRIRTLAISVDVRPSVLNYLWAILRGRSEIATGYIVEAARAVDILAASSPEAAQWWRENTPNLLRPRGRFLFHAEACKLNEG
jgi:hypothetical protein